MELPKEFKNKFKKLLSNEEYNSFIKSYKNKPYSGIRMNSLKINKKFFLDNIFNGEHIPWCRDAYYYEENKKNKLTTSIYYHCGFFYIQEPSAMYPGDCFNVTKKDFVLDLCAAPGGKTIQLASKMKNQGCLIANEINHKRSKALLKNIQLMGIKNTIITKSTVEKLVNFYKNKFDKILIDVPCSGEGMFRKNHKLIKNYDKFNPNKMSIYQKKILLSADELLKPGGQIFYSTCTFSFEENEEVVDYFINKTGTYTIIPLKKNFGIKKGRPDWINTSHNLENTIRFWPHFTKSEGHFSALLQKKKKKYLIKINQKNKNKNLLLKQMPTLLQLFLKNSLKINFQGFFFVKKNIYYYHENPIFFSKQISTETIGLELGKLTKFKFIPSQSLAMAFPKKIFKNTIELNKENSIRFIKGETLNLKAKKNFYVLCYKKYPLGWADISYECFKNKYPKGWIKN